ncbi:MAG TPA: SIMPL domain-containing protein [Allosphingosinicella sp.]|jgi:hypothetical protein
MLKLTMASMLALAALAPVAASAQQVPVAVQAINGTRLDVVATGEVNRVPDIATISAGVVTSATTATAALEQNARQLASVRSALRKAGIADRDIQTSAINLFPDYRQDERGGNPTLIGYRASNELSIRFRDIAGTGRILDALVAQGANQINGPMLSIDKPESALDEARTKALTAARQRAELYARALGKRVGRVVAVSEAASNPYGRPMPVMVQAARGAADSTSVEPGQQALSVSLSVTYELE